MCTIDEMLERWEKLDINKLAGEIIEQHKSEYNELNREQMWDGKDSEDNEIRPSYLEDPFFKGNRAMAQHYMEWKQRITPNAQRRPESPNLFINGYYYRSLDLRIDGDFIQHTNTWSEGTDIDNKYSSIRGLSPLSIRTFWDKVLHDELIAAIAYETGTI